MLYTLLGQLCCFCGVLGEPTCRCNLHTGWFFGRAATSGRSVGTTASLFLISALVDNTGQIAIVLVRDCGQRSMPIVPPTDADVILTCETSDIERKPCGDWSPSVSLRPVTPLPPKRFDIWLETSRQVMVCHQYSRNFS